MHITLNVVANFRCYTTDPTCAAEIPQGCKYVPANDTMLQGRHFFNDLPMNKFKQTMRIFRFCNEPLEIVYSRWLDVRDHWQSLAPILRDPIIAWLCSTTAADARAVLLARFEA